MGLAIAYLLEQFRFHVGDAPCKRGPVHGKKDLGEPHHDRRRIPALVVTTVLADHRLDHLR
jgi:hypothetical protein